MTEDETTLVKLLIDERRRNDYERDMRVAAEQMAADAIKATGELRREREELLREVEGGTGVYRKINPRDAEDAERYWRIACDGCWYVVETWVFKRGREFVDDRGHEFTEDDVGPLWGPIPTPAEPPK